MLDIKVEDKEVQALLTHLAKSLGDLKPVLNALGATLLARVQLGFRTGRAPDGSTWRPLRHRSGQPLRDTGRLLRSFTYRAEAKEVIVGTNTCYAPVHQFGATVRADQPAGKQSLCGYVTKGSPYLRWKAEGGTWHAAKQVVIPPRPFFPVNTLPPDWQADLLSTLRQFLSR